MYPCLYQFSTVDTTGGLKGSGGRLRIIYPIYSSWGAEKEKTPPRIVSYQYRMLGYGFPYFHCGILDRDTSITAL